MGTNVLQLIERAAPPKRRQATTGDIVALASGSTTATRKSTSAKKKRTSSGSTRSKANGSSSGSKKPKAKPPCKYGPRGADGYCPKAPKSSRSTTRNRTRVTAKTGDSAVEQGIQVLTNPNASASQKSQAVQTVGTTVLTDAARKTARKNAPKIKAAVKKYAKPVGKVVVPVAATAGILAAGGKALTANRKREANRFAEKELAKTKKRLPKGQRLTPQMESTLRQQYYDAALKRPVTNSFSGK